MAMEQIHTLSMICMYIRSINIEMLLLKVVEILLIVSG